MSPRQAYATSLERLASGGFEIENRPSPVEVEHSSSIQLIAFREVPFPRAPSLAPSEMLTVRYCSGQVVSVELITPLDEAGLARVRADDEASLPPMRVESLSQQREVRKYSTNSLSGINLVYAVKRRQSQFHPNERIIMLYDHNWCAMEDFRRRR